MATHDRTSSTRALRLVGNGPDQDAIQGTQPEDPSGKVEGELTDTQVAAFAALVAESNQAVITYALEQMSQERLRALAIALATKVNAAETSAGEVPDVGPSAICAIAVTTAAQSFGTTRDAVLGADRHRAVTDARAVAMTAARRGGITLPAIAQYFGKHYTSVMYAQNKVANTPRLHAVYTRIVDQLEEHYNPPKTSSATTGSTTTSTGRSETLQLAALDQAHDDPAHHHRSDEEASRRLAVSAAPAR